MRKVFSLICVIILSVQGFAGSRGSAYSSFGIGDLLYFPNTRGAGMGYTGIGLPATNHINAVSPAAWSRITFTRIEASFLYEGINATEGDRSLYRANGSFNGALLAVPIAPSSGIVFVGGFTPYSNVSYRTFLSGSQRGIDYTIQNDGSGGLGRGKAGLSYSPSQDFSFGVSLDYLFGSITTTQTFIPTTPGIAGGELTDELTANGLTVSAGGLFTGFGSLSESLRRLALGFVISSRGNLSTERLSTFIFEGEADSTEKVTGTLSIPVSYGIGLGYLASERFIFAADFFAQEWANAKRDGSPLPGIRNSFRIGIGGERVPNRDQGAPWPDRVAYRLGFYYHSSYYRIKGTNINEWGITGGVALPLSGDSRINLSLEYGNRGTTENGLVKNNIIRFSASLNVSELWFIRFEDE